MNGRPDADLARAFALRMVGVINDSALGLMISIGYRTRLFDVMAAMPPANSTTIADAAGLNERYVREWLGAMTAGRIVEHDAEAGTYALPPEHAASLTRAAGSANLATMAQYGALLGNVEDAIVECFRHGGGVGYESFGRFQEVMRDRSSTRFDALLVDSILPLVDGIVERLGAGIDVADVGCGAGRAVNLMAKAFQRSRFVGYEFSEEGLSLARTEAASHGLTNAAFEARDVATLDGDRRFDFITAFDAIHDQAQPARVLSGIASSLRDDGVFLCADFRADSTHAGNIDHPLGPFIYTISTMHCMTVSLAYGGDGLGTAWGEQLALRMLAEAGFANVSVKTLPGDIVNNYYVARKR